MTKYNTPHTKYFNLEAIGGIVLVIAAMLGFIFNNSPLEIYYDAFVSFPVAFSIGDFEFIRPFIFWVNDGLIAIFFFLIGLEIKSLLFSSDVDLKEQLTLPLSGAIAGVIVPALIYTAFNYHNETNMRGWAIPTAMDTAFIVGILSLLGRRIPTSLRLFLMLLSIIDDILAVLIIALFYAGELSHLAVIVSASVVGLLVLLNQAKVTKITPYILLGAVLWVSVLGSGVHTSIAGVLLAIAIPFNKDNNRENLVEKLKRILHPYVSFIILPLFAFINVGVDLEDLSVEQFFQPLSMGIILGLFIGKQLGVFGIVRFLYIYNVCQLPKGVTWRKMYGASVLCGVGFTMSLFIGILAFESGGPEYDDIVKASIFVGSVLSALVGYLVLRRS